MEAQTGMCQCGTSTFENSCGCTALDMPESREMTEQTDWRAKATIRGSFRLGRSEVLRNLRRNLRAQSQAHHTIDRLEEGGVDRGSARRSSLKGRERAIVNQTNTGTVSKATLGKPLRDGVERIWPFPSAQIPPCTELTSSFNNAKYTYLCVSVEPFI